MNVAPIAPGPSSLPAPVSSTGAKSAGEAFESMVLSILIEEMLPQASAVNGGGLAGDLWKAQMAQAVAAQFAGSGQIGIAALIDYRAGDDAA